jgi:signal transduction histidine kinase
VTERSRVLRSMRFRIAAPSLLIVSAVIAVLSGFLVESVQAHLISQVDQSLVNEFHYVRANLAKHQFLSRTGPSGEYGQFFSAQGKLIGSGANLQGDPPLIHVSATGSTPRIISISNPTLGRLRVLEVQLGGRSGPILVEAQQINQITAARDSLVARLAIIGPLLALAVGVSFWLVVGRAMRKVESVRTAVAGISDVDSSKRLTIPRTGDEIERLVVTMNDMLGRLQSSIDRERQFVTDASHELRSPIAAARAIVESKEAESSGNDQQLLLVLQRLEDLTQQLLVLDRAGRPAAGVLMTPVDVDEWVLTQAEHLRRTTQLEIDTAGVSGGQVMGSESDISRIIENLASNAARYARHSIAFVLTESDGWVLLRVADDGPGVPDDKKVMVFERFRRLDSDRGRAKGGAGLGLAIVWDLAVNLGGTVRVEDTAGGGACFVVMLPASTAIS